MRPEVRVSCGRLLNVSHCLALPCSSFFKLKDRKEVRVICLHLLY